jgi:hypothetical protein
MLPQTLELRNKMITQRGEHRVEVLFIPFRGYRHKWLTYYALVGKRCQILDWKKDLLMSATRTM